MVIKCQVKHVLSFQPFVPLDLVGLHPIRCLRHLDPFLVSPEYQLPVHSPCHHHQGPDRARLEHGMGARMRVGYKQSTLK
jgi:hypothetical protein